MRKTAQVALAAAYAALYVALVAVFPFLSFLQVNVRVANVLKGTVKLWPAGALLGYFVAVAVGIFLFSPLGFLDVALSPVVSTALLAFALLIGTKSFLVGLMANAALLGVYLSWLISTAAGGPFPVLLPLLLAGVSVSDVVLPYSLYRALRDLGLPHRMVTTP